MSTGAEATTSDPFVAARTVADAVLYEGYVLYPYRASARKNQLRWQFGVLVPPAYAAAEGSERSSMRTEVVADPGGDAQVTVRIRCLQVQHRSVEAALSDGSFTPAEAVAVDGVQWVAWDEAVEHELDVAVLPLLPVTDEPLETSLVLDAGDSTELLTDSAGRVVGRAVRRRERVDGLVKVATAWAEGAAGLVKLTVEVQCSTDWRGTGASRDAVMARSLVAVHTLLAARDADFVSLLDPPVSAREAVAGCANDGTFPVLIGAEGESQVVLSSPIILYDHPAVAPESAGDFCDATEIDEILALRVLTLTDEEKAEARGTDRRAAAIVDRCDDMPPEVWERLHGAVRSIGPVAGATETEPEVLPWWEPAVDASVDPWTDTTWVGGVEVGKGTPVRLNPSRRADAHDLFLAGRTAKVAGVFKDVDGAEHLAVTLDDDPAAELFEWQGRYLFFHPDEVEVLG
ncbi:MAG TPA: hypothetical protein VF076_06505 [Acidimicrobiales bacterium]